MNKYNNIFLIFWIGLSFFIIFFSLKYGLGSFHNPGPGLMPFLLGLLLLIISLYLLLSSLFKRSGRDETIKGEQSRINFKKLSIVLASLFFYGLFLEKLGYVIVTLLTMVILFWGVGLKSWRSILFASGLTVLLTYLLFTYLGVRFPTGILRLLGMG